MNIRLDGDLHKKLQYASELYNLPISEICNRAMRKWNRSNVAVLKSEKVATRMDNPINIRFKVGLADGKTPDSVRSIIAWYLSQYSFNRQTPLILEGGAENIDYVIKEA